MQKVFNEGDIVKHGGTKRLGTVIKTCDNGESDHSSDDSDEDYNEDGNFEKDQLTIQWYGYPSGTVPTTNIELTEKKSLSLINRKLKPGDFVSWANDSRTRDGLSNDQKGQVMKVEELVSLRILSTDFIVKDIRLSELLPLQEYAPRQVVIDDQWVGIIESVSLEVTLQLPNGHKVLISSEDIGHLQGDNDQHKEGSVYHNPEFYKGQTVQVKPLLLEKSSGASQKAQGDESEKLTLAIIDKVSIACITIDWKTYGFTGRTDAEKNSIRPPQPPHTFDRNNIDRIKVLREFNPVYNYLGKRAYYKLLRRDTDSFHDMHQNATSFYTSLSPEHYDKRSIHDIERRCEPQPLLFAGEKVCVEVCNIENQVTVLWQDGSTRRKIISNDLQLIYNLDEQDFFPGDLVNDVVTHDAGIVQSADSVERTCMVKWGEYSVLNDDGTENFLLNESVYSITHAQDERLEVNEIVARLPPLVSQNESSLLRIGKLLRVRKTNSFTVFWSDGTESSSSSLRLTDLDVLAEKEVYSKEEDEDVHYVRPITINDKSLLAKLNAQTSKIFSADKAITLKISTKNALVDKLKSMQSDFNQQNDDKKKPLPLTGTMKRFNADGSLSVIWNDGSQSSIDPMEVSIVRQRKHEDNLVVPPIGITQRYNIDGSVQVLWSDLSSTAIDPAELEITNWSIHDEAQKIIKECVNECAWDPLNDIEEGDTLELYERDIVQHGITKMLGMVIEASDEFDTSSTESEDESTEFKSNEKNITVEWYNPNSKWSDEDNVEVIDVDGNRIRLIDRSLLPGDFVRWAISSNGNQKGQVMDVSVKVYCRVIGTDFILRGVDVSQLIPLQTYVPRTPVTKGQWAGVIDSVSKSVTLLLKNDTRVIITGDNCDGIQDVSDQRKESSKYCCTGFYQGQNVKVKSRIVKEAKWTSGCVRSANNRTMVSAVVDDVGVEGINVDWKIHGYTGDNESDENDTHLEPRPLSYFDETTISAVQEISDFTQADIQIGEKAYYELTGEDMKKYNEIKGTAEAQHDGIRVGMVQGAKVFVEVCYKSTHVTVAWQDGSVQRKVASTNLNPIDTVSTQEFFPGDFVTPKRIDDASQQSSPLELAMGVVESVDSVTGVCDVEWCPGNGGKDDSENAEKQEKINASDLALHKDYIFRIGDIVVRLKPINVCSASLNEEKDANLKIAKPKALRELPLVGQIMKVNNDATIQVRWINNSISFMQPNELHVVREGKDWKQKEMGDECDEFDDNWLSEALSQAEASVMQTSPSPLPTASPATVQKIITKSSTSSASTIVSESLVQAPIPPTHLAPGGRTYNSVQDAGQATLEIYCDNYPNTKQSYVLPVLFKAEHPDAITKDVCEVPSTKKGSFFGFVANQSGEQAEYTIFNSFNSLIRQRPAYCTLVLCNLKLGKGKNILRRVLQAEFPTIDLSNVITSGEIDVLTFVKNAGVVLCEVKRTASTANIQKAEEQLDNDVSFITSLIRAISGQFTPNLPIARVIIIPNESHSSATSKTPAGSHVIDKDQMLNFPTKWNEIVKGMKKAYSCGSTDFEQLVQVVTGIWTMKAVNKSKYEFDMNNASVTQTTAEVDEQVKDGNISSKQGALFTDNAPTMLGDIFRSTNEMNLLYLSPQQKLIHEHYQHVVIRAHAGCGKSLLILFKIIDIIKTVPTQKVIVVAPPPHHIRCRNILNGNGISTDVISSFPYRQGHPPLIRSSCSVLILTHQDFFGVTKSILFSYDLSMLNIFIDDLHAYRVEEGSATYEHIGFFIDAAFKTAKTNNLYAWFGVDVVQGGFRADDATRPTRLFMKERNSVYFRRRFEIPVVVMDQVLRNTKEVVDVLKFARSSQVHKLKLTTTIEHVPTAVIINDIRCGHSITSEKVYCHRLQYGTPISYTTKFLCERVKDFFLQMHANSSPKFDFSTVAILFEDNYARLKYEPPLAQMFFNKFNKVGVQNIEQQLRNLKCTDVVIDRCENAQSFECPSVVFVRSSSFGVDDLTVSYNAISRARTKCMIVDIACDCQAFIIKNVDYIEWKTNMMSSFSRL